MNMPRRFALLSCALMIALGANAQVNAQDTTAAKPDFTGVWLPDSKASGRWPAERPFTATLKDLRAQWEKATAPIDLTVDDEHTSCMPYRLPYIMTTITQYPFEIISTPRRMYLITEVYGQVRRIDIDSAAAISPETLPSRVGVSRARWEGSQLVIETTNLLTENEGGRYPGSPALRMVERMSLVEGGEKGKQLVNEITMHDPLVYEQPLSIRMVYKWAEGVEVGEYICNQDIWDAHVSGTSSKIPWR